MPKILKLADSAEIIKKYKSQNKKIVFTYGTFDLIHSGHAAYLLKARAQGDVLIVGVASNKSNTELRGKGFPLIDQKNRAELLGYFKFVDHTIIIDKQNLMPALKKIKPDIFYTLGVDWRSHLRKPDEEIFVNSYGGKIIKIKESEPFFSASQIVNNVADLKIKEIVEYFFGKIKIDLAKGNWSVKRFSGLKTGVRSEALYFGNHLKEFDIFSLGYFGEIIKKSDLKSLGERLRKQNKKIVLSSGACDLIHAGHARFYKRARALGDVLVLAMPSNRVITKQKGRGRPIVDEKSRAELMVFFEFVDYVLVFDEDSVIPVLEELKPDIFFTVIEEWNVVSKEQKTSLGSWTGEIIAVPPQSPKLSSSKLIRKAAGIRVRQIFRDVLHEAEKFDTIKD